MESGANKQGEPGNDQRNIPTSTLLWQRPGILYDHHILQRTSLSFPQNLECNLISSIGLIPLRNRDGQRRFNIFLWLDSVRSQTGPRTPDGRVENLPSCTRIRPRSWLRKNLANLPSSRALFKPFSAGSLCVYRGEQNFTACLDAEQGKRKSPRCVS